MAALKTRSRGRKPRPALAIVDDSTRPPKLPNPPGWLGHHARAEWRRVVPVLAGRGALGPGTMALLESFCVNAGVVRETEAAMQAAGRTTSAPSGYPMASVHAGLQASAIARMCRLAALLGLVQATGRSNTARGDAAGQPLWDQDLLA